MKTYFWHNLRSKWWYWKRKHFPTKKDIEDYQEAYARLERQFNLLEQDKKEGTPGKRSIFTALYGKNAVDRIMKKK